MEELKVIKIGGNILDSADDLENFLDLFSSIEGNKILVHGGGKEASRQAEKLGIPVKTVAGRRQTDEDTLKIVVQVYAGLLNKSVVAKLQSRKCNALGLTGADLNSIPAKKRVHPEIDFGFVGDFDPEHINSDQIHSLLQSGIVPVFCALTHDSEGNLLNTNADTIASGLAVALSGEYRTQLFYGFEKQGVLRDIENEESVVEHLTLEDYQKLKSEQRIHDGMIPKLDNAFEALKKGVDKVIVGHALNINKNYGTHLYL